MSTFKSSIMKSGREKDKVELENKICLNMMPFLEGHSSESVKCPSFISINHPGRRETGSLLISVKKKGKLLLEKNIGAGIQFSIHLTD